jgi:Na+/proline symporter
VGGFVVVAQFALFLLIGVGLYAFYQVVAPDMVFERPDRVFARFILDEMPIGLLGILLGAIFAAAMSTLSSSLNSCATAAANDFWFSSRDEEASAKTELRVVRILTVIFGLIQIGVGIAGQWVKSSVVSSVLGIAAFTTGIVLGVFFLGIFAKRVGQRAALVGLVLGLGSMSVIFFTAPLAWPWFALVGSTITFAVGWAASYLVPQAIHNEGDLGHG